MKSPGCGGFFIDMVISGCPMLSRLVPQASSTAAEDVGLLSLQIIPARGRTMKDEQEK
jgi:hypothetical protein